MKNIHKLFRKKDTFIFREETMDKDIFENVVYQNEYNIPDVLNCDDVIIDIGAHIGSFSYLCLEQGSRNILAFEPWEPNYELIKKNLNRWIEKRYIHVFNLAVWENDNVYLPYIQSEDRMNTGGGGISEKGTIQIKTISLDTVLKSIKKVKLLKIDAEGSECHILLHAKNIQKIEYICGEYHGGISTYNTLKSYLRKNGFDCTFRTHKLDSQLGTFFVKRKDLDKSFFKDIFFDTK